MLENGGDGEEGDGGDGGNGMRGEVKEKTLLLLSSNELRRDRPVQNPIPTKSLPLVHDKHHSQLPSLLPSRCYGNRSPPAPPQLAERASTFSPQDASQFRHLRRASRDAPCSAARLMRPITSRQIMILMLQGNRAILGIPIISRFGSWEKRRRNGDDDARPVRRIRVPPLLFAAIPHL